MKDDELSAIADEMTKQYRHRRNRELKKAVCLIAIGVLYLLWCRIMGFGIPCIFHVLTGLYCPGCGMTRAIVSASHLRIREAFEYNMLSVTVLPVLVILLGMREFRYIRTGSYSSQSKVVRVTEIILFTIMFIAAVLYGFFRNITVIRAGVENIILKLAAMF